MARPTPSMSRARHGEEHLYVVQGHDHSWLQARRWPPTSPAGSPVVGAFCAKTPYRQKDAPCGIKDAADGVCLGGGTIA